MGFWRNLFGLPSSSTDVAPVEVIDAEIVERGSSFDSLLPLFQAAGGLDGPLIRTSGPMLDEEQIVATVQRAYQASGPVFALVVARMQVFSQIRFQWRNRYDRRLFPNNELEVLERPWRGGTTADLLARMELDASVAGNAYIRRLYRLGRSRLVRLRPDWVSIILGSDEDADHPGDAADVDVLGYAYRVGGWGTGSRAPIQVFSPDEVAHYAPLPDPDFHYLGQSWITPVLADVRADSVQTLHKEAFLRNAATPNLLIKFGEKMTLQQIQEFKDLMEAKHAGAVNAYKTLYLGGGADASVIGKDFKELDFAATQGKGESRLAAAAGVPPSWVGFSEGLQGSSLNAGNFNAARRRFSDGTMQHLWANAAASLEPIMRRPDNAELWFTTKGIPFLAEDAKDTAEIQALQAQAIRTYTDAGFKPDAAVDTVMNVDLAALHGQHSGLFSVQLQPPAPANGAKPAIGPAPAGDDEGDTP